MISLTGQISRRVALKRLESQCQRQRRQQITGVQVADALHDPNDDKWVCKLAQKAVATQWQDHAEADAMLAALLRLPPHLLHRVLSSCLQRNLGSGRPLSHSDDVITSFPASLHPAIVSLLIADTNLSLSAKSAPAILTQLPHATPPQSGLRSLELKFGSDSRNQPAAATGALLARAISSHTSLSKMILGAGPAPPHFLHSFAACLPSSALPALTSLAVCAGAHTGGSADVAACLALLPALKSINLTFFINRPASAAAVSRSTYSRLAASPATLPALEHLIISECGGLGGATKDQESCVHMLLPLLKASELTTLELTLCATKTPVEALFAGLTSERFPALVDLLISTTGVLASAADHEIADCARPRVEEVYLNSPFACPATVPRIAEVACKCFSSLTSLSMNPWPETKIAREGMSSGVTDAWLRFLVALRACHSMQELTIFCLYKVERHVCDHFSTCLADALRPMSQLTSLQLWCGDWTSLPEDARAGASVLLNGRSIGDALSTLRALELLSVYARASTLEFDSVQPVLDACARLSRLEDLHLCCQGVSLPELGETVGRLSAVTAVAVLGDVVDADEEAFDAMMERFPAVRFETW